MPQHVSIIASRKPPELPGELLASGIVIERSLTRLTAWRFVPPLMYVCDDDCEWCRGLYLCAMRRILPNSLLPVGFRWVIRAASCRWECFTLLAIRVVECGIITYTFCMFMSVWYLQYFTSSVLLGQNSNVKISYLGSFFFNSKFLFTDSEPSFLWDLHAKDSCNQIFHIIDTIRGS